MSTNKHAVTFLEHQGSHVAGHMCWFSACPRQPRRHRHLRKSFRCREWCQLAPAAGASDTEHPPNTQTCTIDGQLLEDLGCKISVNIPNALLGGVNALHYKPLMNPLSFFTIFFLFVPQLLCFLFRTRSSLLEESAHEVPHRGPISL